MGAEKAHVTLLNRRDDQCAWIDGNPVANATVCGSPVIEGRPYCAHHAAIAYVPWTPRNGRLEHLAKAVA